MGPGAGSGILKRTAEFVEVFHQTGVHGLAFSAQGQAAHATIGIIEFLLYPTAPAPCLPKLGDHAGNGLGGQPGHVCDFNLRAVLIEGDTPEYGVAGK